MSGRAKVVVGAGAVLVVLGVVAAVVRGNTSYLSIAAIGVIAAVWSLVVSQPGGGTR